MNQDIKVSVIMGVYNSNQNSLEKAILSILNQTYKNIELIICDDFSTNGITDYLKKLSQTNERITFVRNENNQGLAFSLNQCLKYVTGDYIARQDDDDVSDLNRFAYEVKFLSSHPEFAFVGTWSWLVENGEKWGESRTKEFPQKEDFLFGVPFTHPTIMVRKEAYLVVGGYRSLPMTRRTEDYDLYMRLYSVGYKGYNIQKSLFYYSQPQNSYSKRKLRHRLDEIVCRYEGYKLLNLLPKGYVYLAKPLIAWLVPNRLKHLLYKKKFSHNE